MKKILVLYLLIISSFSYAWVTNGIINDFIDPNLQVGSTILGTEDNEQSGMKAAISKDGRTIAINSSYWGSNRIGRIRIFRYDDINWNQLGTHIEGTSRYELASRDLAISGNGNVIATTTSNGNEDLRHVRVYRWNQSQWVRIGGDIGLNSKVSKVSLNDDGTILAIGAGSYDATGTNRGQVIIYEWNEISWIQKGQNINGESDHSYSGNSISLSADGERIAIGAYWNDVNTGDRYNRTGHVRVYDWNNSSNDWTQIGSDIDGPWEDAYFGSSVSLTSDGSALAVSYIKNILVGGSPSITPDFYSSGCSDIYFYDELINGKWRKDTYLQIEGPRKESEGGLDPPKIKLASLNNNKYRLLIEYDGNYSEDLNSPTTALYDIYQNEEMKTKVFQEQILKTGSNTDSYAFSLMNSNGDKIVLLDRSTNSSRGSTKIYDFSEIGLTGAQSNATPATINITVNGQGSLTNTFSGTYPLFSVQELIKFTLTKTGLFSVGLETYQVVKTHKAQILLLTLILI